MYRAELTGDCSCAKKVFPASGQALVNVGVGEEVLAASICGKSRGAHGIEQAVVMGSEPSQQQWTSDGWAVRSNDAQLAACGATTPAANSAIAMPMRNDRLTVISQTG